MRVLLDTHALLWSAIDDKRLSEKARSVIENLKTDVYVSAASAWEVTTNVRLGKLPGAEGLASQFAENLRRMGFLELTITDEHLSERGNWPGHTAILLIGC
jgi:PIN domain nuclease of toxin-antitoxin system